MLVLLATAVPAAHAEDSVVLYGNYYKERSTRVVAPSIVVTKDLPADFEVRAGYLVDQITSASGSFTKTDQAFREYRQELQVGLRKRVLDTFTPGLSFRYSHEPDYRSISAGADVELPLARQNTVLRAYFEHMADDVYERGTPAFHETLATTLVGLSATQVLTKNMLGGLSFEAQLLRGYTENPYRVETHPNGRNRYAAAAWLGYHVVSTDTTGRVTYRFYADDWDLTSHTLDLEVSQQIVESLGATARFRWYSQGDACFALRPEQRAAWCGNYSTTDPKLSSFGARYYELKLHWALGFLQGSFLDPFRPSEVQLSYGYLDQDNTYGPAHVAQLGWYWPF